MYRMIMAWPKVHRPVINSKKSGRTKAISIAAMPSSFFGNKRRTERKPFRKNGTLPVELFLLELNKLPPMDAKHGKGA